MRKMTDVDWSFEITLRILLKYCPRIQGNYYKNWHNQKIKDDALKYLIQKLKTLLD